MSKQYSPTIHVSQRGNFLIGRTILNMLKRQNYANPWELQDMIANGSGGDWQPTIKQVRSALYRLRDRHGYVEKVSPHLQIWKATSIGRWARYGNCVPRREHNG